MSSSSHNIIAIISTVQHGHHWKHCVNGSDTARKWSGPDPV
jgi:hypothetical protein